MCDSRLTISGEPTELARFLEEIGLDREAEAAARKRMGRLVERRDGEQVTLHVRAQTDEHRAYCGTPIDEPQATWASPGWRDRDLEPASCEVCHRAAEEDATRIWGDNGRRGLLSFADIVPLPTRADEEALHQWVVEHWGTKWDLGATGVWIEREDAGEITINMSTAWGAPLPVVAEMARRARALTFSISWEGEDVGAADDIGEARWANGEMAHYAAWTHAEHSREGAGE